MQIFDVIIFFKLRTIQQKTVRPTYLCPLGARKLAEGKGHETSLLSPVWNFGHHDNSGKFRHRMMAEARVHSTTRWQRNTGRYDSIDNIGQIEHWTPGHHNGREKIGHYDGR